MASRGRPKHQIFSAKGFMACQKEQDCKGFFCDGFTEVSNVNPAGLLNHIETLVRNEMNDKLMKEFTVKEISDALFHTAR